MVVESYYLIQGIKVLYGNNFFYLGSSVGLYDLERLPMEVT